MSTTLAYLGTPRILQKSIPWEAIEAHYRESMEVPKTHKVAFATSDGHPLHSLLLYTYLLEVNTLEAPPSWIVPLVAPLGLSRQRRIERRHVYSLITLDVARAVVEASTGYASWKALEPWWHEGVPLPRTNEVATILEPELGELFLASCRFLPSNTALEIHGGTAYTRSKFATEWERVTDFEKLLQKWTFAITGVRVHCGGSSEVKGYIYEHSSPKSLRQGYNGGRAQNLEVHTFFLTKVALALLGNKSLTYQEFPSIYQENPQGRYVRRPKPPRYPIDHLVAKDALR